MDNIPLDLSRTALLLVDLQNDNVHPDGAFASSAPPTTQPSRVWSPM